VASLAEQINRASEANELRARRVLQATGYTVERLDGKSPGKAPDWLVLQHGGPVLIVEVKSLLSGGVSNRGLQLVPWTADRMGTNEPHWVPVDDRKVRELVIRAREQYRAIVEKRVDLAGLPFVVAFYFSFSAGSRNVVNEDLLASFPEVSGVVREAQDWDFWDAWWKEPVEKRAWRERTRCWNGLPPYRFRWRLLTNPIAVSPLPRSFIDKCELAQDGELGQS
jgi:hypothetical protein